MDIEYELVILFGDGRPEQHRYAATRDDALAAFDAECARYPKDGPGKPVDIVLYCNGDTIESGEIARR